MSKMLSGFLEKLDVWCSSYCTKTKSVYKDDLTWEADVSWALIELTASEAHSSRCLEVAEAL